MLYVRNNGVDISEHVENESVTIDEQGNNRRDTASFTSLNYSVGQGTTVEIWETLDLREQAASGQGVLKVKDTFEWEQKWRIGDVVVVDIPSATRRRHTITAIDHVAREVTVSPNFTGTIAKDTKIGRLRYAGVVLKNPQQEMGKDGRYEYDVDIADWGTLFDRKNVVDTFEDQYPREIMGRIMYRFVANDSEATVDSFETAWTHGGTAIAMSADSADRLHGTNSQSTGITGAGTATWTKTITSMDLSAFTHLRFWWKAAAGSGADIDSMTVKVGTDASNFYSYSIANIGSLFDDLWNYEAITLRDFAAITGAPNLAAVTWVQIEIVASGNIAAPKLHFDHMLATTGGFTLQNMARGSSKFADVRGNHSKPAAMMERIAKQQGMFWYIDYERDLHYQAKDSTPAPFALTATSQNFGDLKITPDSTKIVNVQTVRGAEAASDILYTQESVADGRQTSWYLDYKPKDVSVWVAPWNGTGNDPFVQKTVGVENLVDDASVDFVFNFQEKTLRNGAHATLAEKDIIKITYYPFKAIRVRVKDPTSIAAMKALTGGDGIYEGRVINDQTIRTYEEARLRAQAEINAFKNPIITATYKTEQEGLHVGMVQLIDIPLRGISDHFLIQKVGAKQKVDDRWRFDVTAGSTLFGLIEFMQMLFSRSDNTVIDANEIVDVVVNMDETITLQDSFTFTKKPNIFLAGTRQVKWWDFVAEKGVRTSNGAIMDAGEFSNFYAEFQGAESGSAGFVASGDNDGKSMRLVADTGGAGNSVGARTIYRMPIKPATQFTFAAWIEFLASLTNVNAGGGLTVQLKEYAAQTGGSALQTTTVLSGQTVRQNPTQYATTFTTHASAAWFELHITLSEAAGTAWISDILLQENAADSVANPGIASFAQAA